MIVINERKPLSGIQRLLEAGLILSCASAVFLLLALFSFDPADPGFSQTARGAIVKNMTGPAGAWLADLLFFVFGMQAFLVPFAVAFLGWFSFKRYHRFWEIDFLALSLRLFGGLLLVLGFAGLASLNFDDFYFFSSGGILGDVVSSAMLPLFNLLGSVLLLLCFLAIGFTLATGISWLTIVDGTGTLLIWAFERAVLNPLAQYRNGEQQPALEQHDADTNNSDALSLEDKSEQPAVGGIDKIKSELKVEELAPVEHDDLLEDESLLDQDDDYDAAVDDRLNALEAAPEPVTTVATGNVVKVVEEATAIAPLPSIALLDRPDKNENPISQEELEQVSRLVELKLLDFGIEAKVVGVFPGPVITRFELDLAPGVKVSKISNLSKDLARALSAISVRIVEVIPGKSVIGLEIPNKHREIVRLSEVISDKTFDNALSPLTMVLGKDIGGKPVVVDLAKMPHLLVAGTTGSGKSVGVNVMILSLLYKSSPDDVRLIMIDPKMLELSVYEGIPHLLCEVVTDMKEAANGLRWCVGEMERRYKLMSALGVRNLKGFNAKVLEAIERGEPIPDPTWKPGDSMDETAPTLEKLPSIVVVVDEFADMMMIVGKKVEELIARIAQKARAAGIHLILATQRPSVDVITGLIKANIPTRIAFQVSSRVDSRTILDQQGAEQLLGQGDMLYLPPGTGVPTRVHGAFVDDHEVHAVVEDWKKRGKPNYLEEILSGDMTQDTMLPGEVSEEDSELDPLYDEAVAFVTETRRGSISGVQRKFKIGYNRAARLVEQMEASGVVSPAGHNGNRDVLAPPPPKD